MDAAVELKNKVSRLPSSPGVYLFKNSRDLVLYIGKAISLKDRVRSYFQDGASHTVKTKFMVTQIADLEYIATKSELEAFLLESNLIKKHRPKYNIMLRDDKQYPYLCLPVTEDFPRLKIVRRVKKDGNLYFGPYIPSSALKEAVNMIRRYFPLATCKIEIDGKADRPCLEFQIKRCMAPCTGYQSKEDYRGIVNQVRLFLEGKDRELIQILERVMEAHAGREAFEEAAVVRDRIAKIKMILERQRVSSTDLEDQDVIALAREGKYADMQILFVRGGLLVGRWDYFWDDLSGEKEEVLFQSFIEQYYAKERLVPKEIFIPIDLPGKPLIEKWLSEKRGKAVYLKSPSRGKDYQLLSMAEENARHSLQGRIAAKEGDHAVLKQMESLFGLPSVPRRVEAIDISNIMGTLAVGSLAVMENGKPNKNEYRRFQIKTVEGANDFAMIHEVVSRRFGPGAENFPDLLVIDGGKGQLSQAMEAMARAGVKGIPVIGLAKEKGVKEERIFFPGRPEPMILDPRSPVTHLLVKLRDEAHRFAVSYHRHLRGKKMVASLLDTVPGIGPTRKRALLLHFKTFANIRSATLEALSGVKGMTAPSAQLLFDHLHGKAG